MPGQWAQGEVSLTVGTSLKLESCAIPSEGDAAHGLPRVSSRVQLFHRLGRAPLPARRLLWVSTGARECERLPLPSRWQSRCWQGCLKTRKLGLARKQRAAATRPASWLPDLRTVAWVEGGSAARTHEGPVL